MPKISALVVNHNSAVDLDRCLSSVADFVDEAIVVDLESTDNSKSIAKKYKAQFIPHKRVAVVEEIRQEVTKHAKHEYILFLDPDESLGKELKTQLKKILNEEEPDYIEMPRKNIIFDSFIRHSRWWPDYQIRLFKKNAVTWPREMHAQPYTQGHGHQMIAKEGYAIIHHNYSNLTSYLEKNIRYAQKDAEYLVNKKSELTIRTTMKKALSEFISRYFAGEGYRDGVRGFMLAFLQMFYYFLVLFYYWERHKFPAVDEKILAQESLTYFKTAAREVNYWKNKTQKSSIVKKTIHKLQNVFLSRR